MTDLESKKTISFADCLSGVDHCRSQYCPYRTGGLCEACNRVEYCVVSCSLCFVPVVCIRKTCEKHTARIIGYEGKQWFIKFFDLKAFMIMAVMMSGGIWLRVNGWAPDRFIAVIYSGLGVSLVLAGILFGVRFFQHLSVE